MRAFREARIAGKKYRIALTNIGCLFAGYTKRDVLIYSKHTGPDISREQLDLELLALSAALEQAE